MSEQVLQAALTVVIDGEICFWYAGESESGFDYFRFSIDGADLLSTSGTTSWTEACYPVTAGARTFRWQYSKDSSVSTGRDRYAIDDVRFPLIAEACDDGNVLSGDGCSMHCFAE